MSWLQSYISYYVQITAFLQIHKTMLLKTSSAKENIWKQHISQMSLNKSISEKICAFEILQNLFVTSIFLVHFNSSCQLYIIVYHVKNNSISVCTTDTKTVEFPHHKIQFILFLNKILTSAERNYWFTEMKMTELV